MLQKRFEPKKLPPITKWTNEKAELLSEKSELNEKYLKLKSDVSQFEKIRKNVSEILSGRWHPEVSQVQEKSVDLNKIPSIRERMKVAGQLANEHNVQQERTRPQKPKRSQEWSR